MLFWMCKNGMEIQGGWGKKKKWQLIGDYNKITTSISIIEIEIVGKRPKKKKHAIMGGFVWIILPE